MRLAGFAKGQAVMEWALWAPLFVLMAAGIFAVAKEILIHQQLLIAAKEGAFLYSSGRLPAANVQRLVQQSLRHGWPSLEIPLKDIHVGRSQAEQARRFRLDEVKVVYRTRTQIREETCAIKHAPGYWISFGPQANPPIPW